MASTNTGTVVGYFATEAQAEAAVSALKNKGFSSNQIGIALSDAGAAGAGTSATGGYNSAAGTSSTTPGTHVGQKAESAWERIKNFFEGGTDDGGVEPYADEKARGSLESHEITPAGGYAHSDFADTLGGMDVSADRSRYFGHKMGAGSGAVVTVSAAGREREAEEVLMDAGGDVGEDAVGYDYGTAGATGSAANTTGNLPGEERRIQLLGEVLRVHKDRISRGEVRLRKEVVTEQQTVQVPVSREELVIERIPVASGTPVTGTIGADSEIRIPLSEEVASADKDTVVREEVALGKRSVEGVQEVGGAVRHEELEVEDTTTPGISGRGER